MQRTGTIVIERKQTHQLAIAVFGEGVESEQTLSIADGGDRIALLFKKAEQSFECLEMVLAKPLPLRQDPFIIAARK